MNSPGHRATCCPTVGGSISTRVSSMPGPTFKTVSNSLLEIARLCSRNPELCGAEVAANSTGRLCSPQMFLKPHGLSGQVAPAAGQLLTAWTRSLFCSRPYHCGRLWRYDPHSVSLLKKREPSLHSFLTTGQTPGEEALQLEGAQTARRRPVSRCRSLLLQNERLSPESGGLGDAPPHSQQGLLKCQAWGKSGGMEELNRSQQRRVSQEREKPRQRQTWACFARPFLKPVSVSTLCVFRIIYVSINLSDWASVPHNWTFSESL